MRLKSVLRSLVFRNPSRANYKFVLRDWARVGGLEQLRRALETQWFSQQLVPIVMAHPIAERVLVIAPHPDDEVLGAGGTLLRCRNIGTQIAVAYVTSAANPTTTASGDLTIHAQQLEREARAAAARLTAITEFWRFDKRAIPVVRAADRLAASITLHAPQVIFLPFFTDDHPDHRACSEIFAMAFRERHPPAMEVWAYQVYSTLPPNVIVDVTEEMEEKLVLIDCWESQKRSRNWGHYIRGMNAMQSRFLHTNAARYAETFFVLPAADYLELCRVYLKS